MPQVMNFGIVGCGAVAEGHARTIASLKEARLVAVADIDEKKGKEFAKNNQARFYQNYHELLALKEIEAVDICTPNYLHAPIGSDAAKVGKHVFT